MKQVNTQESLLSKLHYGVFKRVGTLVDVHKFLACDANAFLIYPRWRRTSVDVPVCHDHGKFILIELVNMFELPVYIGPYKTKTCLRYIIRNKKELTVNSVDKLCVVSTYVLVSAHNSLSHATVF